MTLPPTLSAEDVAVGDALPPLAVEVTARTVVMGGGTGSRSTTTCATAPRSPTSPTSS